MFRIFSFYFRQPYVNQNRFYEIFRPHQETGVLEAIVGKYWE